MAVFHVGDGIDGIDLFEEGRPERSSAYLIRSQEPILVETGSARSHHVLVDGLRELGVAPEDLRHIIVTHVHLDHAGGVGQMMQAAPKARLHCHPRAARHLVDPSRLEAGARAVYGEQMDEIFGPLMRVPEDRVVVHPDHSVLNTGDRELVFFDTPGHAKHHACVLDQKTMGLFSGDTVGIRYAPGYTAWDFVYGFPTTTPSDFDPDVMLETLDRLQALNLSRIYHTHFGVTEPAEEAFSFSRRGIHAIQRILPELGPDSSLGAVQDALRQAVAEDLAEQGHPGADVSALNLDIMLNSQGILVYLQKKAAGKL
ncbi:MBL fold metallo-hydrolase [Sulfobacillus harzensis]|uniref:MBL fold metallo-hydrolase n=1 Tax=Sulfobacillus harzensis TaxID=2729629 RepID=A0A7Y0L135_9FIRM|nr:MBL fold metallo-hydrolase [Sulfobacillus harzensis]NMP21353.1 MBL fold metallo-hydrolase [Sulfobacillus harzensis]